MSMLPWLRVLQSELEQVRTTPQALCIGQFLHSCVLGLGRDGPARRVGAELWDAIAGQVSKDMDALSRVLRLVSHDRELLFECALLHEELTEAAHQTRQTCLPRRIQVQLLGSKLGELFATEGALNLYLSMHRVQPLLVGRSWACGAVETEDGLGVLGVVAVFILDTL